MNAIGWPVRRRLIVACLFLVLCQSCTSPPLSLSTRPIQTKSTWFVRLDASTESDKLQESLYDHPVEWAEPDIAAILERLLLQQETGILGQHRSREPVLSSDEVAQLTPALHTAFSQVRTREWVSFAFLQPSGTNLVVISGGFFFKKRQLHVVLANYREIIHEYAVDIELVRKNPFRSLRGLNGHLRFDPAQFVTDTTTNWSGHSDVPASEIALDYRGVHDYVTQLTPSATPRAAAAPTGPGLTPSPRETSAITTPPQAISPLSANGTVLEPRDLSVQVRKLETQIEVLTQRAQKQDSLLLKLSKELETLRSTKNNEAQSPSPSHQCRPIQI